MSYKQNIKDNILKTLEKDTVKGRKLTKEMRQSFLDYSMSVIKSRALPDYRDGLKPVHRRIIYAAYQEKLTHEDKYKKSAAIVGSVMGSYHPHGDSAIYDALVRMTQEFSLRYPLIQGQGNFGSIDGDSPAAMRYTEARLSEISSEFLEGVDESWIEEIGMMTDNYDQSKREPIALPTLIPNVLVNGGEGIAVGMATKIPPHNLSEVIDASIALIDNPNLSDEDIFKHIKGPDFPTGGEVMNYRAVKNYFSNSSRGEKSFRIRSKAVIESLEDDRGYRIVFTEIPYGVKKSQIIKRIADLINPDPKKGKYVKELGDYIDEVRDESSREGIRIVVECDKYCSPEIILNNLYKHTRLQLTYSPNLTVLVDNEPKKLSILEILKLYLSHQQQILKARLEYKASKLKERIHILDGRLMIIDDIVEAVKIITNSDYPDDELKQKYFLDDIQLKDILSLPIGRLKKLSSEKMRQEREEKLDLLRTTENILGDKNLQDEELKKKLTNIKEKYGDDRRTIINSDEFNTGEISVDSLRFYLPSLLVMFKETKKGGSDHLYLNKVPMSLFKERRIDSKKTDQGPKSFGNSHAQDLAFCKGGDDVLFFSKEIGSKEEIYKVYKKKAYELDLSVGKKDKGSSLLNIDKHLNIENTSIISIPREDYSEDLRRMFLVFATKKGNINAVKFSDFININSNGKKAYRIAGRDAGDEIYKIVKFKSDEPEILEGYVVLFTSEARVVISPISRFRIKNRNTTGIRSIKLSENELVGFSVVSEKAKNTSYIFTINKYGKGKFTEFDKYRVSKAAARGVYSQAISDRAGNWKKISRLKEISNTITPKLVSEHKLPKSYVEYAETFFEQMRKNKITKDVYDALSGKITAKSMADYLRKTEQEVKKALESGGIPLSKEKIAQKLDGLEINKKIKKLYRNFTKHVVDKSSIVSGFVVNREEWEDILIMTQNNRCVRFNVQDMIKKFEALGRNTSGKQILKGIEENSKYDWDVLLKFAIEINVEGVNKPVLAEGHLLRKTYNDKIVSAVKIPASTQDTE